MNVGDDRDAPRDVAQARVSDLVMRWAEDRRLSTAQLAAIQERIKASAETETQAFWDRVTRPLVQALEVLPTPSSPPSGRAIPPLVQRRGAFGRRPMGFGPYVPYLRPTA